MATGEVVSVEKELLEKFGAIVIKNVRDESITDWDMILDGRMKGQRAENVRALSSSLSQEQKDTVNWLIPQVVDTVLHHFLWTIEEHVGIDVIIKDESGNKCNIRDQSDGLPGELYTDEGWIARFSKERYSEP